MFRFSRGFLKVKESRIMSYERKEIDKQNALCSLGDYKLAVGTLGIINSLLKNKWSFFLKCLRLFQLRSTL